MQNSVWIIGAFVLALWAGPVASVSAKAGVPDPAGIYLVVGRGTGSDASAGLMSHGVRELGLSRAPFGRLVVASPDQHRLLNQNGYLVLPASFLAEICGLQ
ncbi:hypothetical protein [Palleronia pelagia]|uniref:Uncharacterized protein n=1 Tax=Palleronia pelagia TaxID=387096 RepID=A0A1H8IEK7_9RHOB|nr:hypothetical protein [Palleronia pelagia]SEN67193.1 hypothetical protein SAMN04488011_105212 [Palleronia pelagia]